MYYCTTCGAVFDEPGVEYQMHAFGDGYASEPRSCCPKCGVCTYFADTSDETACELYAEAVKRGAIKEEQ